MRTLKSLSVCALMAAAGCGQIDHDPAAEPASSTDEALLGGPPKPKIEIFANQQPVFLFKSVGPTAVQITGVVYDANFNGVVQLEPNGPAQTACPVFVAGSGQVSAGLNQGFSMFIILQNKPDSYGHNCALRYRYSFIDAFGQLVTREGLNQVNVPYVLKNR